MIRSAGGVKGIVGAVLVVVALGGGERAAAKDSVKAPELTEQATLEPFEVPRPYLRNYPLRGRREPAETPQARVAAFGEERVVFVDVDGNGKFGDRNVDGWTLPGDAYRYLVPIERWIVVGKRQVWLEFAKDGATVSYGAVVFVPVERPGERLQKARNLKRRNPSKILAALVAWNDLRLRHGLVPGRLDDDFSIGCHAHADYCARNGITHVQDAAKPGYTKEGALAGKWSGIGSAEAPVEVDLSHRAFYHRMQLIHATTVSMGIGYAKGVTVLDGSRDRSRRPWIYPVCIPAPDTTDHPRSFSKERPVPHPRQFGSFEALKGVGCPITLTFRTDDVTQVRAELREKGPKGKMVDALVSSPDLPANREIPDNYKTIGIIPRKSLKSRKTYWVHVRYVYEGVAGERTWTFKTGSK